MPNSRRKGKRGEREFLSALAAEIEKAQGESINLTRNLQQTRGGGADCLDLEGWAIEVKRCERLAVPTWWKQACRQAKNCNRKPVLAYRRNRQPWTVLLDPVEGTPLNGYGQTIMSVSQFAEHYVKSG